MFRSRMAGCMVMLFLFTGLTFAQNQLDPRPLDPEKDPDIDMYLASWKDSIPFNSHGALTERTILTKCDGDPLKPTRKGEVLNVVNRLSRAILDPFASTVSTTLKGEQEIFYVMSGTGIVTAGDTTHQLRKGALFLIPEGLEFTIGNTGDTLLEMYLINESVPSSYKPADTIKINYEDEMPLRNSGYIQVHWSHNGLNVFTVKDGLGTLESVNILTFNAMTIGQPHSHDESTEEVWTLVEGKNLAFLGKEIRWQEPGAAYKIPPNGQTPHSNINTTEKPAKFLYFSRFRDHEVRK